MKNLHAGFDLLFGFPVDTGRKLNVHKLFRGRSGRLLNVLCTFNLRPVSTGSCVVFLTCTRNTMHDPNLPFQKMLNSWSHPEIRRRGDVVTKSPCTSQQCRRYVSNETPNDVSEERCLDVSVVHLYDVLFERRDDVLRGRNNDVPSVSLHDVSNKSQLKHPTTSHWYVTKMSQHF